MRNVDDIYALTPMQRLMLMHAASHPAADVLANRVGYEIRGDMRPDLFRRAWDALVERHAALRTAFLWRDLDQPVQVVRTRVDLPFVTLDLSGLTPDEQAARLDEMWRSEARQPFELGRAPLMRCTLARLGDNHHQLIWSIHHLVVDRWSHGVLFADLAELYRALLADETPRLPPATGFRHYVAWLQRQDEAMAERFWRMELAGFRRPTLLADEVAPGVARDRRTLRHALSEAVTDTLVERASSWRTALASLVLAAVTLEVARQTRSDDVVFGLAVSGRPPALDGVEEAVGSFVNNMPVRARVQRGTPVDAWVRGIARAQLERQPFEYISLASLHDWSELPSSRPLFDLLVVINLTEVEGRDWPVDIRPVRSALAAAYPLTLGVTKTSASLDLVLVHDPSFTNAGELLRGIAAALEMLAGAAPGATLDELLPGELTAAAPTEPSSVEAGPVSANPAPAPASGAAPDLAGTLLTIWSDVLGTEEIGLDDDFFALGGTSLQAARIFARIERLTGRALPLSTLIAATSVRALLGAMDETTEPAGPLIALRSGGARRPLFVVPGIGGNVVGLLPLARELATDRPFFALQSRGLDGRDQPLGSVESIAEDFVEAMGPSIDGGFHLVGACWGAAVAFDMARQLVARGRPPLSLALLDPAHLLRKAGSPPPNPLSGFILRRARLYRDEFLAGDWSARRRTLASKAGVAGRLLRSGGIPDDTRTEVVRQSVHAANLHAIERYVPRPLEARARIFITGDRETGVAGDPRLEWLSLIRPTPGVAPVPGFDSGDAITANVTHFAAALRSWIEEVEQA